jgi:peroxiredoxin Q/BCP
MGNRPLLIDTPGCTTEGQDFRDHHQAFLDANTIIYGVSKDDLTKHEKFKSKQEKLHHGSSF